jgi:hypothetical protein
MNSHDGLQIIFISLQHMSVTSPSCFKFANINNTEMAAMWYQDGSNTGITQVSM